MSTSASISSFDDLLRSARQQAQPQRLLFVFVAAELPDDATADQRARFEAGEGGTLTPLMCVDKTPDELPSFDALASEARQFGQPWSLVFAAAMAGSRGAAPSSAQAEDPLQRMVECIKSGRIDGLIPFDASGQPVQLG
jgi:hypothetical protein